MQQAQLGRLAPRCGILVQWIHVGTISRRRARTWIKLQAANWSFMTTEYVQQLASTHAPDKHLKCVLAASTHHISTWIDCHTRELHCLWSYHRPKVAIPAISYALWVSEPSCAPCSLLPYPAPDSHLWTSRLAAWCYRSVLAARLLNTLLLNTAIISVKTILASVLRPTAIQNAIQASHDSTWHRFQPPQAHSKFQHT
jgi:hypothetical protein